MDDSERRRRQPSRAVGFDEVAHGAFVRGRGGRVEPGVPADREVLAVVWALLDAGWPCTAVARAVGVPVGLIREVLRDA